MDSHSFWIQANSARDFQQALPERKQRAACAHLHPISWKMETRASMLETIYHSSQHKDAVYAALLRSIDCGPFDGGCLAFATAMQKTTGEWSRSSPARLMDALRLPSMRF